MEELRNLFIYIVFNSHLRTVTCLDISLHKTTKTNLAIMKKATPTRRDVGKIYQWHFNGLQSNISCVLRRQSYLSIQLIILIFCFVSTSAYVIIIVILHVTFIKSCHPNGFIGSDYSPSLALFIIFIYMNYTMQGN